MAFPSVVKLSTFICILLVLLLNVNTAIVQAHPSIEARRTLNLPSQKNVSQSAIDGARKLIRQVLVEVGAHNKKLNENPRRNIYMTRNAAAQKHRRRDGISAPLTVNTTVTAAAALLAEVDAAGAASVGNLTIRSNEERDSTFWMETISHSGTMPFGNDPGYKVYRNVKDYGAQGDGVTDDTAAINNAISDGNRCGAGCLSSTVKAALVYFPSGIYLVSGSIIAYYNTQLVGNPNDRPTIKAAASFVGLGVISTDVYIDGGNGAEWYINQNNFLRQIRNFIIDIQAATVAYPAGIHYQVAQATSLQNIDFYQSTNQGTTQQGIFSENGSGGFMSDLNFFGGNFGFYGGNQQFTVRNLKFSGCNTAIQIIWDWGWTWKSLDISGGSIGINLLGEGGQRLTGSIFLSDSIFTNVPVAVLTSSLIAGVGKGNTLITFDNVVFANTPIAVQDGSGQTILAGGSTTIASWTLGNVYEPNSPQGSSSSGGGAFMQRPTISSLMGGPNNGFFERSKPQYETVAASGFTSVKSAGARGDGATDDTAVINSVLASAAGNSIVYFPAGSYIVTDTIQVPPGSKIVGECWSQIVGKGSLFANMNAPYVMVQVGQRGQTGDVEISDMLFTSTGATAGIIVMEWNLKASSSGSAGMWDSHFRIGGAMGTGLQAGDCPIHSGSVKSGCIAGSLLLHLTSNSSAYLENVWAWTADHDIDDPNNTQVDIYVARGVLIESQGPSWFYGTSSEHSVMYQYEAYDASDIYMAMIQTESPYFQPSPQAPAPFESTLGQFSGDFDFRNCPVGNDTAGCATSWGLRVVSSTNVIVGGAGLYSWFNNYDESCVDSQSCQVGIVSTVINSGFWLYNLITIGAQQMVSPMGSDQSSLKVKREVGDGIRPMGPFRTPAPNLEPREAGVHVAQVIPRDSSTVVVVITETVIPIQGTPCPAGTNNTLTSEIVAALAPNNTIYSAHPFTAIIIAWLLEAVLNANCYVDGGPVRSVFAAMGDSFGSGIGAGVPFQRTGKDQCKRGEGGLGYQLYEDPNLWWNSQNYHFIDFIACSGAKTYNMFADGEAFKGLTPQDKAFEFFNSDIAVLWIGGNDIGFFNVLDGCVFWFYAWSSISCDVAIRDALLAISSPGFRANLTQVYTEIINAAHPQAPEFTLYVTGYARFWNQDNPECDDATMSFWGEWTLGPYLTRPIRTDMNDLLLELNSAIQSVVREVAALVPNNRRIVYVDIDSAFEGHRFCEVGSKEPNPINDNNYFFQLKDQDTTPDGHNNDNLPSWPSSQSVGTASLPSALLCNIVLGSDEGLDFGDLASCEISLVLASHSNYTLANSQYKAASSDFGGIEYSRIFHPKSIGYAKVKEKVMSVIRGG